MNAEWKEYVDDVRELIKQDEPPYVTRLLKLIDAQDAVVKAAQRFLDDPREEITGVPLRVALRNLAELKLE